MGARDALPTAGEAPALPAELRSDGQLGRLSVDELQTDWERWMDLFRSALRCVFRIGGIRDESEEIWANGVGKRAGLQHSDGRMFE